MIATRCTGLALAAWIVLCAAPLEAREDVALDAIRDDLRALRFEAAAAAVTALLEDPETSEEVAIEARALRAQARVATGEMEAALEDWRSILLRRPSFEPERPLFPSKALARFDALRDTIVGRLRFDLVPQDALVTIDGGTTTRGPDGEVPLLAGTRRVDVARRGFDPESLDAEVEAGRTTTVTIRLEPNARTVVVRSEPAEVEVRFDGRLVGTTTRSTPGSGAGTGTDEGRLLVEDVPLGEIEVVLSKPCHRPMTRRILVTADLMDLSPLDLPPVVLPEARGRIALRGAPEGAIVSLDGVEIGATPLEGFEACPGRRRVELGRRGRIVWASDVDVPEIGFVEAESRPRPLLCLVGDGPWPPGVDALRELCSPCSETIGSPGAPLAAVGTWGAVGLPDSTDIAIGVERTPEGGAPGRLFLYSAVLGAVEELPWTWTPPPRPVWTRPVAGLRLADSSVLGAAIVVETIASGPAATAGVAVGDRIVEAAGTEVRGADDVIRAIRASAADAPITLVVAGPDARSRRVTLVPRASPALIGPPSSAGDRAWVAAWASVDAASVEDPASALANLALALSRGGSADRAAELWPRVVFRNRGGVGDGTVSYMLGRDLAATGRLEEAREAFRKARDSAATYPDDEGIAVTRAASDHLDRLAAQR